MTTRYPDISHFQEGLDLSGTDVICAKATQGTGYTNPLYERQVRAAAQLGFAYHFLESRRPQDQADHCFQVVGKGRGLMLDIEFTVYPDGTPSNPNMGDAYSFIDRYRSHGGVIHLAYLPHWYWHDHIGAPDLSGLRTRNVYLVSSEYPSAGYSSDGPGWDGYGGSNPIVWQYTSKQLYHGFAVDFNAFKGSVAELRNIVLNGKRGDPVATGWRTWFTKGGSSLEEVGQAVSMAPASILRRTVEKFGPFDDVISGYVNDVFEGRKTFQDKIPAGDGKTTGRLWVRDGG